MWKGSPFYGNDNRPCEEQHLKYGAQHAVKAKKQGGSCLPSLYGSYTPLNSYSLNVINHKLTEAQHLMKFL